MDELADGADAPAAAPRSSHVVVALVAVGVVALVVAAAFVAGRIAGEDEVADGGAVRATAVVEQREAAPTFTFEGQLTYADEYLVVLRIPEEGEGDGDGTEDDAEAPSGPPTGEVGEVPTPTPTPTATITELPSPGEVVGPGGTLFERDARPVLLLPGAEPAFRTLAVGVADGADVAQLERWLVDQGFDPDGAVTVDEAFTEETAEVVAAWQRALGLPDTGEVPIGDVVFAPGALRVVGPSPPVEIGPETFVIVEGVSLADSTPVVVVSSVEREVVFEIGVDDRGLVSVGDPVDVELPDRTSVPATISEVRPSTDDPGRFSVTVEISGAGLPEVDRTPVTVTVTGATASGLFVPADAIVARDLRGYAVEVVGENGRTDFVDVEIGAVAGRSVQVMSSRLAAGTTVISP